MNDASPAGSHPITGLVIAGAREPGLVPAVRSLLPHCAEVLVVLDPSTTDGTEHAARGAGARVVHHPFRSFVEQKNAGVDAARHDWILSLDADEVLSGPVENAIRGLDLSREERIYRVRRRNRYLGIWVDWTGWRRDAPVRLFNRRRARFSGDRVHERVGGDGTTVVWFTGHILHRPYRNLEHHVTKINRYTSAAAGGDTNALRLVLGPPWKFIRMYVLSGGFLHGTRGFILSAVAAAYVLLKHAKRWEARHVPPEEGFPPERSPGP